ncbi:MAG TPA: hypothetical protein V6C57_06675 [Coleofasciculaceae cyanobacterium]
MTKIQTNPIKIFVEGDAQTLRFHEGDRLATLAEFNAYDQSEGSIFEALQPGETIILDVGINSPYECVLDENLRAIQKYSDEWHCKFGRITAAYFIASRNSEPKTGFRRVWFNDGIGTTTGWRDIPESRIKEAEEYEYEEDGCYQAFDFSLEWQQ